MKVEIFLRVLSALLCISRCQCKKLVVDVVEIKTDESYTFVCNLASSTNLTRWTYLAGLTGTSLMSYQNRQCRVSPSGSFLSDSNRYSYACNSPSYQVTVQRSPNRGRNNDILACKNAHQLDSTGSAWIIKTKAADVNCSYCQQTVSFVVIEISEGDKATLVCSVSSNVSYVNWIRNKGAGIAPMSVQNGQCNTEGSTFLDNTSKYIYTCNRTVYQVTIFNVTRNEHNDIYMCTTPSQTEGKGSNWIVKVVKAPVTSVTITSPPDNLADVKENTAVELTCTTSTARPSASVYWYKHPNGQDSYKTKITSNVSTTTDYNDLSVTTSVLRLFVTLQDNNTKVFCKANNPVNTTELVSKNKILLIVLCAPKAAAEVNTNITSAKNASKTITVNVIAYPPPKFIWSQLMNGIWTPLQENHKFVISSSGVQSNLTIRRVGMDDFTKYRVVVTNEFGQMETTFTLSPYGVPETPTEFRHIQSQTTTSSIHIGWRPGYNGGPFQTFYIKYKKSSDSSWTYITVIDNGEETMDFSLNGLVEDTQYDIVIFASNIIGNSSESEVLVASTEGLVDNPMYISSNPVAHPAPPSSDVKADLVKPDINDSNDLYAQVQKTKKKDVTGNGYEFLDVNTDNNKKSDMKKPAQVKATTNDSKMSNINQDGLKYADLVFNSNQPVEKKEMKVYEPTPYDLVDFTNKAEPLPDSDDDDNR